MLMPCLACLHGLSPNADHPELYTPVLVPRFWPRCLYTTPAIPIYRPIQPQPAAEYVEPCTKISNLSFRVTARRPLV